MAVLILLVAWSASPKSNFNLGKSPIFQSQESPITVFKPVSADLGKEFFISELKRTIGVLAQEPMTLPAKNLPAMLDQNHLVSWFDLSRPESQGVYYRVLGLPIQDKLLSDYLTLLLRRTKSEFFQMSQKEQRTLKIDLQLILEKTQEELSSKPSQNTKEVTTIHPVASASWVVDKEWLLNMLPEVPSS